MTATGFSLIKRGELVALALVCAGCRYAAVVRPGSDWVEHRAASLRTWREIDRELTSGFAPGPIPRETEIYRLLALGTEVDLRWTQSGPLYAAAPQQLTLELDAMLCQSISVAA